MTPERLAQIRGQIEKGYLLGDAMVVIEELLAEIKTLRSTGDFFQKISDAQSKRLKEYRESILLIRHATTVPCIEVRCDDALGENS